MKKKLQTFLNLHLSNVLGLGARNILEPFLIALNNSNNNNNNIKILNAYFPPVDKSLENFTLTNSIEVHHFERKLPNWLSRLLEIIFWKPSNPEQFFLVFGDIPLRRLTNQILYLHSTLIIQSVSEHSLLIKIKYLVLKFLFFLNINNVKLIIVQSKVMRSQLFFKYPNINIVVMPPPPGEIYYKSPYKFNLSKKRFNLNKGKIKGFYPASFYEHKNHALLKDISSYDLPFSELVLTINPDNNPDPFCNFIKCTGEISNECVYDHYLNTDALIFLSLTESYGLPLVESMSLGIPIICPNLPYARELCQDQAIYFNVVSAESFKQAVNELILKLQEGWKPNYSKCLKSISSGWDVYASKTLEHIVNLPYRPNN
ncbi:glycosyltransferase [Candidatus Methylopumilus universalis]|uniref:glycosyltransferase n=1 Tax=Candidatus Methylopumilus universalis TaxID=2588536 RepID=UPI0011237949|nr:glycosyltransferase [Candidatus Methylopumilus universalis]QDC72037.1 glycosyltransferase family 4 protein [Candidatus Methylopumilus universalis]